MLRVDDLIYKKYILRHLISAMIFNVNAVKIRKKSEYSFFLTKLLAPFIYRNVLLLGLKGRHEIAQVAAKRRPGAVQTRNRVL